MKKLISLLVLIIIIVASHTPVTDVYADYETIKIYGPDGCEYRVFEFELEQYKSVGYYTDINDVIRKLYAPDGREISVFLAQVPAYKAVGWYENLNDVISTVYAPDGREAVVYLSELPSYLALGWYADKSYVTTVMAAPDGRKITVYNSQITDYINVGWIPVQSDSITTSKPIVALTFDDGPRPASTGRILNTLEAYNARATFFVVGYLAVENATILQRMQSLGCQIGNHSYSHPDLTTLSASGIATQLNSTANAVYSATGLYPTVIRPPYGSKNSTLLATAMQPLILWSIDTLDWKYRNADRVTEQVLSYIKDGDIVLMHDLYDTTAAAVERIVPELIKRGYQLVTVDELAAYKNKPLQPHNFYTCIR